MPARVAVTFYVRTLCPSVANSMGMAGLIRIDKDVHCGAIGSGPTCQPALAASCLRRLAFGHITSSAMDAMANVSRAFRQMRHGPNVCREASHGGREARGQEAAILVAFATFLQAGQRASESRIR